MSYFEVDHRRRIDESVALLAEMLPTSDEEVEEIRAEYRDSRLCDDGDLMARTDAEVDKRMHVHARLGALWMLMNCAQDSRDEALSRATAEEMKPPSTGSSAGRRSSDNLDHDDQGGSTMTRNAEEGPIISDVETMTAWAKEEARNPTPPSEDDELKEALRLQNFQDRFMVPDPTDHLSDAELWELMPESIKGNA